jgi:MFS family permease
MDGGNAVAASTVSTEPVDFVSPQRTAGHSAAARMAGSKHGWFTVIWLIYLIDYADRFAVSAVLPAMQKDFALSDVQAGLMSGSLFLGLAILAVPCGLAVDRYSRKYMITLMTLIWSVATWSTGLAKSFSALMASRVLVGAGEAGYNPAGYALIAAWYPARLRGTMVGIFQMAQPLGIALGVLLAGHLAARFGWRAVFGVLAVPGLLLALLMLFAPDYKTRRVGISADAVIRPGLADTLRFIAGNRTLQLIYLAQLPITAYIMAANIWAPTFVVRQYGLGLAEAATAVSSVMMLIALGAILGGWLSDRLSRNNPRARIGICLLFLAGTMVLHTATYIGSMHGLPLNAAIGGFAIGGMFATANWGTLVAAGLDQSPPQYRASAQSFLPMFQAIATVFAGVLSGALSDLLGLTTALAVLCVIGMVCGFVLLVFALRTYDGDYRRQHALGSFEVDIG